MPSRFICLAGPLRGKEFVLGPSGLTVGRHESNDLVLDEAGVSRRHCSIVANAEGFVIADHASHNHTWVNGVQVDQALLRPGDQISIGVSAFRYVEDGAGAGKSSPLDTIVLRRDDAVYLQPHSLLESTDANPESVKAVKLLLEVIEAMFAGGAPDALAQRLIGLVRTILPVTTAGLVLFDGEQGAVHSSFADSGNAGTIPTPLPNAILRRVFDERLSICTNDILADEDFDPSESLITSQMKALIAVPVIAEATVIGVLHGTASRVRLDSNHLQLLTGVAGAAASSLASAMRVQRLEKQNRALQEQVRKQANLVGISPQVAALHVLIAKIAPSASTVLILGESGTGKELVAAAIHRNSPRSAKPFVAINCAALTESLLESELFGHEKGAFTGAVTQKRGKFEEASGGTLFLDEIGELAPGIQAKLLRVLQERIVTRVGGNHDLRVDVRVIAATNRDLGAMSRAGQFRQDLYFRLNVIAIQTPALRDRREDIPVLADHFLEKLSKSAGRRMTGVSQSAMRLLQGYDWPGNVRELENVIERAMVLGSAETIGPEDLPDTLLEAGAGEEPATTFHELVNAAKRDILVAALQKARGNQSDAARQLGIHPNNLHRLIRNLAVKWPGK